MGGRTLSQRSHHQLVGGEAEVLRPLEGDVQSQGAASRAREARGEGDDRHEGGLNGADRLGQHPRLLEQAAGEVGLPCAGGGTGAAEMQMWMQMWMQM